MKKEFRLIQLNLLVLILLLMLIDNSFAAINLPWSTTYNCGTWTAQSGKEPVCDGIIAGRYAPTAAGNYVHTLSSANYTGGGGGLGQRNYIGKGNAGVNDYSGETTVYFSSGQNEIWIRWYMRFEQGFYWAGYDGFKVLYFLEGEWTTSNYYMIAFDTNGRIDYYSQMGDRSHNYSSDNFGWTNVHGGSVSDGSWHCYEVYIKSETSPNFNNGVFRAWVDGQQKINKTNVNHGLASRGKTLRGFYIGSNAKTFPNIADKYVDFDDIYVTNAQPAEKDSQGFSMIGPIKAAVSPPPPSPPPAATTFIETFDNSNFSSRGWYDNTSPVLSTTEHVTGSASSVQYKFLNGSTTPVSGGAMRKTITEADSVYVSFHIKHSSNWVGSNKSYHPHLFYVLTNKSSEWNNLAYTNLTAYIEQNDGYPLIGIQDGENIDESKINQNLTSVTEYRSVAGCNGDSDGYGNGSCYQVAVGEHWNWKQWKASTKYFSDSSGPNYKGDWHHIEAYIKLNSISNGKATKDGALKYWYDGNLVMDYNNVVLRTGEHPDMKFNQFVIAPWIGDGSPVEQTFWIDNLTIDSQRPDSGSGGISSPTGLKIVQ